VRYGTLDHAGAGLHDIWGFANTALDATLSVLVLAAWATVAGSAALRIFHRTAVT
jgi:hypothetical protein